MLSICPLLLDIRFLLEKYYLETEICSILIKILLQLHEPKQSWKVHDLFPDSELLSFLKMLQFRYDICYILLKLSDKYGSWYNSISCYYITYLVFLLLNCIYCFAIKISDSRSPWPILRGTIVYHLQWFIFKATWFWQASKT